MFTQTTLAACDDILFIMCYALEQRARTPQSRCPSEQTLLLIASTVILPSKMERDNNKNKKYPVASISFFFQWNSGVKLTVWDSQQNSVQHMAAFQTEGLRLLLRIWLSCSLRTQWRQNIWTCTTNTYTVAVWLDAGVKQHPCNEEITPGCRKP